MIRNYFLFASLAVAAQMSAVGITSPSGDIVLDFNLDSAGQPYYSVDYKGRQLVAPARMGLVADEAVFTTGFHIESTDTATVDRSWEPVWGEYSEIRDHFRELAVNLKADSPKRFLTIRFRVFDDGVGFRYELPVQDKNYLTIKDELTEFNFTDNHKLYCIPGDYDTDEYLWSETTFSELPEALNNYHRHSEAQRAGGTSIQTPMLLKTNDAKNPVYVNIHEAALIGSH